MHLGSDIQKRAANHVGQTREHAILQHHASICNCKPEVRLLESNARSDGFQTMVPHGHLQTHLNHPVAFFRLNNTFDTKWITASVLLSAQTEGNMGNKFVRRGFFSTDLSVYKSLMNNRLTLQLYASDLFGTADACRIFYSGPRRSTYYKSYSSSSLSLTIRYQFNVTNSKYKGTSAGQSQRSRM